MHNLNPSTFYVDPGIHEAIQVKLKRFKRKKEYPFGILFLPGDPPGARTQDPILKRDVLYLLS